MKKKILLFFGDTPMSCSFLEHLQDEDLEVKDVLTFVELVSEIQDGHVMALLLDETVSNAGDFNGKKVSFLENSAVLILNHLEQQKSSINTILLSTHKNSLYRHEEKRLFASFLANEIFRNGNWEKLVTMLKSM